MSELIHGTFGVVAWGNCNCTPLNFDLLANFLLIRKFPSKNAKFKDDKYLVWQNLGAK